MKGKNITVVSRDDRRKGKTNWEKLRKLTDEEIEAAKIDFDEDSGTFSPDGRWLAYRSNESGRSDIYVQAFHVPEASGRCRRLGRMVLGGAPTVARLTPSPTVKLPGMTSVPAPVRKMLSVPRFTVVLPV